MNGPFDGASHESDEHNLVMPFVVCQDHGGPYETKSFVAGWQCGFIDLMLHILAVSGGTLERYVYPETIPQLDLIAMRHRYVMEYEHWDEQPDEWVFVRFHHLGK